MESEYEKGENKDRNIYSDSGESGVSFIETIITVGRCNGVIESKLENSSKDSQIGTVKTGEVRESIFNDETGLEIVEK